MYAFCTALASSCTVIPFRECDPYIKIYLCDAQNVQCKEVLKTAPKTNRYKYNPRVTFTTEKISKDSTIQIEVWDDSPLFGDALIQITNGNVESFLNEPLRNGVQCEKNLKNSLETMSFWSDELRSM